MAVLLGNKGKKFCCLYRICTGVSWIGNILLRLSDLG